MLVNANVWLVNYNELHMSSVPDIDQFECRLACIIALEGVNETEIAECSMFKRYERFDSSDEKTIEHRIEIIEFIWTYFLLAFYLFILFFSLSYVHIEHQLNDFKIFYFDNIHSELAAIKTRERC